MMQVLYFELHLTKSAESAMCMYFTTDRSSYYHLHEIHPWYTHVSRPIKGFYFSIFTPLAVPT